MASHHQLAPWGDRARSSFRNVFAPLFSLSILLNLLDRLGVPVAEVLGGPVAASVVTVVIVGFLATGAVWLVAEVRAGYQQDRP